MLWSMLKLCVIFTDSPQQHTLAMHTLRSQNKASECSKHQMVETSHKYFRENLNALKIKHSLKIVRVLQSLIKTVNIHA